MVANAQTEKLTFEEYLELEDRSQVRHEFVGGEIHAMAGATVGHNAVVGNLLIALGPKVRKSDCRAFVSDMKVRVEATAAALCPDLVISREPLDRQDHFITDARLIIEVLSPSTADHDRGAKLKHYIRLPGLAEYVLIDSQRRSIDVYRRQEVGWQFLPLAEDQPLVLESVGIELSWDDVYEGVSFGDEA